MRLDETDRRILRVLQREGRIANAELAERVGLSPSPCLRRVRLLEEAGVIERYVAVLASARLGLSMTLFTRVWLLTQDAETIDRFVAAMRALEQVMECYIVLGECDAMLRVVVADLDGYRRFQTTHLTRANGIANVKTDLPSQVVKRSYELPL